MKAPIAPVLLCFFAAGAAAKPEPYAVRNRFSPNTFSRPHHYDGAKDEPCEIIIHGIGPSTSARVGAR